MTHQAISSETLPLVTRTQKVLITLLSGQMVLHVFVYGWLAVSLVFGFIGISALTTTLIMKKRTHVCVGCWMGMFSVILSVVSVSMAFFKQYYTFITLIEINIVLYAPIFWLQYQVHERSLSIAEATKEALAVFTVALFIFVLSSGTMSVLFPKGTELTIHGKTQVTQSWIFASPFSHTKPLRFVE